MYQHKGSYDSFNLLRFLASFSIALFLHTRYHFFPSLELTSPFKGNAILWSLSTHTTVLVELFFIISGMLFTLVYLPRICGGQRFDSFFMKRAVRLYPMVIITSLVTYGLQLTLHLMGFGLWWKRGSLDLNDLFVDLAFGGKWPLNTQSTNNVAIWYIGVLLVCYVIAFLLASVYRSHPNKLLFALPFFLGVGIIYQDINFMFINTHVARGLVAFFEGCLLEFALQRADGISRGLRAALLVLSAAIVAWSTWMIVFHTKAIDTYAGNLKLYCSLYVFPSLIFLLYHAKHLNALCGTVPCAFLGKISFGLYLWNMPILAGTYLLIKLLGVSAATLAGHTMDLWWMLVAAHLLVSVASYQFVERPLTAHLAAKLCETAE